jgi:glycosyltransferase involved in cell wall biosynthesis
MAAGPATVWVLVSNDLTHDQRVLKTCESLADLGFDPRLLGRELPQSPQPPERFSPTRLRLGFHDGPLFYLSLQFRFFAFLFRRARRSAGIWANDLDTLLPAWLIAKLYGLPVMYDSHEFFTEAAGLTGHPMKRAVWLGLERMLFPRLKAVTVVNDSIAEAYSGRYPHGQAGRPLVVRNMPRRAEPPKRVASREVFEAEGLRLGPGPLGILQGAFLDEDRGVREAVAFLAERPNCQLVIVGAGPEWVWAQDQIQHFPTQLHLLPKQPYDKLRLMTRAADWGFSLDRPDHGNYLMSLPNKLFDYIHAGIPVVASPMPEVAKIVESHGIGTLIDDFSPASIAAAVDRVLAQDAEGARSNAQRAADQLHWGAEEPWIHEALRRAGFTLPEAGPSA